MRIGLLIGAVVFAGLAAAGWVYRGAAPLAGAARAVGLPTDASQPQSLQAAGVHKCVGSRGTRYLDGPCPAGTREVAATHGTMTVTSFPKPAPTPSALASSVLGGPIVKPIDPEERDRLREKAIDDAANRR
jgi:hypothetical protein